MKIPKTIKIIGRKIDIKYSKSMKDWGEARFESSEIILHKVRKNMKNKNEHYEATFLHEVVHWILYLLGEEKNNNEEFVERLSETIYQIIPQIEDKNE